MAQVGNVLFCGLAMAVLWTLAGLPFARGLVRASASWLLAPAIGCAVFNVFGLLLFQLIGMTKHVLLSSVVGAAVVAFAALQWQRPIPMARRDLLGLLAIAASAIALAAGPMAAVLPKVTANGVTVALPIFDHAKVALVDEMIRVGVPPNDPFFFESGTSDRIGYYYLWHFGAAAMAVVTGVSGWEADAALTFFTGFAFLTTAAGLAAWLSGRLAAAFIALALAVPASARLLVEWMDPQRTMELIRWASGFGGWLFQTSWAPQHIASANWIVLACVLLQQMTRPDGFFAPITLGLLAAAGFQSSVWIGGIVAALAALAIVPYLLATLDAKRRRSFLLRVACAGAIAIAISAPMIIDQVMFTSLRGGVPIVISPVVVLGDAFPESLRRVLDIPAYWLVYLPVELPALYPAGLIGVFVLLRDPSRGTELQPIARTLVLPLAASLLAAWLLRSVIGNNNDLGWRTILPALMLLIVFAAAAIARWRRLPARVCALFAAVGALLGLPDAAAILYNNVVGSQLSAEQAFAAAPAVWEAVRRHAGASERIANNPLYLADMTRWPVNISWALLADRRSCYAGRELATAFAPIPAERRAAIEAQFTRVFAGEAAADDVEELAGRFQCDVVLVTAADGAWQRDPFVASGIYRLMETEPDAWRIYRRAE